MTNNNQSNIELYTKKSNEQRLKSLEEYERERQKKKSLIRNSINRSSHVKFDSDEDDNTESQKPIKTKKFQEKKIQLFDDQEMVDVEEHFNEKKQSKKKNKLQKLQAQLTTTNDPRFQLTEQFIDGKNDEDEEEKEEPEGEISFEEEKKKSLAILDQITNGKPSTVAANPSKPKMIRFDPSKTEHKIYEIDNNQEKKPQTEHIPVKSQPKSTAPIVDDKRTYEFDQSKLKSSFDKSQPSTQNGSFQFSFFNSQESFPVPTPKIIERPKPIPNGKSKVFLSRPDETSSEEDEAQEKKTSAIDEAELKNQTFFFFDIDERLKEGLEKFVRTEDLNNLERAWPAKRKEIAETLRTKHRKAV